MADRPGQRPTGRRAAGGEPEWPEPGPLRAPYRRVGRGRLLAFGVIVVVALAGAGIYVARQAGSRDRAARAGTAVTARAGHRDLAAVLRVPHLILRSTALGPTYGDLVAVPLANPAGPRADSGVSCERVYAVAARGLCMSAHRGIITTYAATVLDADLHPTLPVKIIGGPTRTRLSADGRYAATTVFVAGHSYTDVGFSTVTEIVDTTTGGGLGNLEGWRVVKDGRLYHGPDDNFWGVTFAADDTTFYATLSTGGHTYLVRGDIAARQVTTVRENAECPSLSPDGRVVVYKKATGGSAARHWRFTALDIATGVETPLPETRSVDDQVAWLDAGHVMYGVPRDSGASGQIDVWVSPVPPVATGASRLLVPDAESPAVVRQ